VETFILDHVYQTLPEPPYTPDDKAQVAQLVYRHIWQQSVRDQWRWVPKMGNTVRLVKC